MRYRIVIVVLCLFFILIYSAASAYAMWADTMERPCFVTTNHVDFGNGVTVDAEAGCATNDVLPLK